MITAPNRPSCASLLSALVVLLLVPSVALAGPEPTECADDGDCMDGTTCIDGWCGFDSECQTDPDCVALYGEGAECMFMSCGGAVCSQPEIVPEPETTCETWADCEGCDFCVGGVCTPDEQCLQTLQQEKICDEDGGLWNECATSSCPMCTDCIAACVFPPATQKSFCEATEGVWDECASSSCPTCDDCIGACTCPAGSSATEKGCVASSTKPKDPPPPESDPKDDDKKPEASPTASKATGASDAGCSTTSDGRAPAAPLLLLALALLLLGRRTVVRARRG